MKRPRRLRGFASCKVFCVFALSEWVTLYKQAADKSFYFVKIWNPVSLLFIPNIYLKRCCPSLYLMGVAIFVLCGCCINKWEPLEICRGQGATQTQSFITLWWNTTHAHSFIHLFNRHHSWALNDTRFCPTQQILWWIRPNLILIRL